MPAIQVANLKKSFPKTGTVFDSVSFEIENRSTVALVGPSGSGKTTLLRILSGLDTPDGGTASYSDSRQIGDSAFVFQEPSLVPWLTVFENVALPLILVRKSLIGKQPQEEKVLGLLKLVGLSDARDHLPRELSGGMKMRVSLARALVTEPRYLFLDEPFSALDEVTRLELEEELGDIIVKREITTVLVTHSITEAVFLSDRIFLISSLTKRIEYEVKVEGPRPRGKDFRFGAHYNELTKVIRGHFENLGGRR